MNEKCVKSSLVFWLNERKVSLHTSQNNQTHISHLYLCFFFWLWHINTTDWNSWRVFVISVAGSSEKKPTISPKQPYQIELFLCVSSSSGWFAIGRSISLFVFVVNNIRLLRAILIPFYRYRSCIYCVVNWIWMRDYQNFFFCIINTAIRTYLSL